MVNETIYNVHEIIWIPIYINAEQSYYKLGFMLFSYNVFHCIGDNGKSILVKILIQLYYSV